MAVFLLVTVAAACSRTEPRTLDLRLPRTGSQGIALAVEAGQVTVLPSRDGTIHVDVTLKVRKPRLGNWTTSGKAQVVRAAVLQHDLKDGVTRVSLVWPQGTRADGIDQVWTVTLPPVMHVAATLGTGHLEISGVAGGVEAAVTTGDLAINIPYGAVQGEVGTGNLDVSVHTLDYGTVSLDSGTGTVQMTLDGAATGKAQVQGAGQRLEYQGSGKSGIRLSAKIGQVQLALMSH